MDRDIQYENEKWFSSDEQDDLKVPYVSDVI